ncbi:MAG TPA: methionine--tRNA ligase [Nitrososphaerales archaeon]|nr:methionine--tRNA ligase [Nitrososphaerales archaeon]
MTKWVVTSAWPYSSDIPHLGNMIGSVLSADVFARFNRLIGNEVVFVSGSDEHGTPLEVEALKRKIPVRELADQNHQRISDIFRRWNISYDNYTRTDSEAHWNFTRELYSNIYHNDSYIFTQVERIHYCTHDDRFLPDRFVEGICPFCGFERARGDQCDNCGRPLDAERLINAYCVICKNPTELRETKQWFFDLPKMSDYISDFLSRAELSTNVIKFCKGWIKDGLRPRSITRDSKWGIKAPFPGAEDKTIYVWMDAVLGYVSAVIEYFERIGTPEVWKEFWLDSSTKTSFFIGKDNIPFHAIILPSLLKASGQNYNEPNLISSTEFLNFEGQKFSKSRKIGIWTDEALELLPADYWRFALISLRPEAGDVNFGWESFSEKVNNDLNDTIGNFVNRTLVGVSRFADNHFQFIYEDLLEEYSKLVVEARDRHIDVRNLFDKVELQSACRAIVAQGYEANRFLSSTEPWKVVKHDKPKALQILYVALSTLKLLTSELYPIIPETSLKISKQAGIFKKTNGVPTWNDISLDDDMPIIVSEVQPIFSKVKPEELKQKLEIVRTSK